MSLDLNKLEKLRDFADGKIARCPACAESGQDRKGEHLRIYSDGKFGCCVHPGDSEHRKRIFALAGQRGRRGIQVRVSAAKSGGAVHVGILGRLGRVFTNPMEDGNGSNISDATDGANEFESGAEEIRTVRTDQTECNEDSLDSFRTARTPSSLLTRIANKTPNTEKEEREERELKGFCPPVRSVREQETAVVVVQPTDSAVRLPFFTPGGTLSIPMDSPPRYHWWNGGQSVAATLQELKERINNASPF